MPHRVTGVLTGVLAAALSAAAVGHAPTAAATCVSVFGLSTGPDCSSTIGSAAIAIGAGTQAHAEGLLGAAFAFGTDVLATTAAGGVGNFAITLGYNSNTSAGGWGSVALVVGASSNVSSGTVPAEFTGVPNIANIAVRLGDGVQGIGTSAAAGIGNISLSVLGDMSLTTAIGVANTSVNFVGRENDVVALGTLVNATNLFGSRNTVTTEAPAGGTASLVLNAFGDGNRVGVGRGPLAIAASLGQTGQTALQEGPGITVNGFAIPGSAAVRGAETRRARSAAAPRPAASTNR